MDLELIKKRTIERILDGEQVPIKQEYSGLISRELQDRNVGFSCIMDNTTNRVIITINTHDIDRKRTSIEAGYDM